MNQRVSLLVKRGARPFERQALVAELAVEALVVAVLPGFVGIDQGGVDAGAWATPARSASAART